MCNATKHIRGRGRKEREVLLECLPVVCAKSPPVKRRNSKPRKKKSYVTVRRI